MDTPDVDPRREAALRALEWQLQELKMFYGAGAAVVEADTKPDLKDVAKIACDRRRRDLKLYCNSERLQDVFGTGIDAELQRKD